MLLDESIEEERVTRWVPNAFLLSQIPLFQNAGFDGEVYLGLVANSPRTDAALGYIRYLAAAAGAS